MRPPEHWHIVRRRRRTPWLAWALVVAAAVALAGALAFYGTERLIDALVSH